MKNQHSLRIRSLAAETLREKIAERRGEREIQEELETMRGSFPYFLFRHCYTVDEHDPGQFAKPFPRWEFMLALAKALQTEHRLAVEKSRQLMVSWICCAFVLWKAMFTPNALCFVQSKKEDDAADRLDRIYQIYFRLPKWLQERFPMNMASGRPGTPLHLELHFTWHLGDAQLFDIDPHGLSALVSSRVVRARIRAIPQGGDIVRQFTSTLIFSDEAGFQEEASESYTASAPTLAPTSHYITVSSANPGFFESLTKDQELR